MTGSSVNRAAVEHARDRARHRREADVRRIEALTDVPATLLARRFLHHAAVTVNFHPDRLLRDGRSVTQGLLADGVYRSQFETGISNGGLTAFEGGDRDRWEHRLFGRAYAGTSAKERPKYGGLNLMNYPDGACPRFGSCHFILDPHALGRATFSFGDSVDRPTDVGVIDEPHGVLAACLEAAHEGHVLGCEMGVGAFVAHLVNDRSDIPTWDRAVGRALDHYIEAQIHGPIPLATDVIGLVVDPSFRNTEVGDQLEALAAAIGAPITHHRGFQLAAEGFPDALRGPGAPALAHRIAEAIGGPLTAHAIGQAAQSIVLEPERWIGHGTPAARTSGARTPAEGLQQVKHLWHILVSLGGPF